VSTKVSNEIVPFQQEFPILECDVKNDPSRHPESDKKNPTPKPTPSVVRNPTQTPPKTFRLRNLFTAMCVRRNFPWGATSTFRLSFSDCWPCNHGHRKRVEGGLSPLDFENFSKNGCLHSFQREKNKYHHFWPPLEKIYKNPLVPPPGKNSSDAHGCNANGRSQNTSMFLHHKENSPWKHTLHSYPFWNLFHVEL